MKLDLRLTIGNSLLRCARRDRRHPAGAHGVAVVASLRPHSGARSEVARPTHCAHFVRYVQTTAASQLTKRADARRPRPCAHQSPTNRPRRVPPAARATVGSFHPKEPEVSAKACPGRLRSACEAPSRRARTGTVLRTVPAWRAAGPPGPARPARPGLVARARSALRQLTCRRLSERSERSERSELGDGPRDRAAQGSLSEAKATEPKRSSLPGHAFAALPVAGSCAGQSAN
jgi:hypothetical protein